MNNSVRSFLYGLFGTPIPRGTDSLNPGPTKTVQQIGREQGIVFTDDDINISDGKETLPTRAIANLPVGQKHHSYGNGHICDSCFKPLHSVYKPITVRFKTEIFDLETGRDYKRGFYDRYFCNEECVDRSVNG